VSGANQLGVSVGAGFTGGYGNLVSLRQASVKVGMLEDLEYLVTMAIKRPPLVKSECLEAW
jgi:hypothetical protein